MDFLEKQFKLKEHGTDIKTEVLAGITTFATMAYVLATVPSMMGAAGFSKAAVLTMVIILCAVTSTVMGFVTNRPFVLGPGLGSVGVYAITMIVGEEMSPAVASGVIFWEGILFVIISFVGLRDIIVKLIPLSIKISISAGIGLFISLLGFKNAGIIVANAKKNVLGFGDLTSPTAILAVIGLIILLILEIRKINGGVILAIILTTIIGIPLGVTKIPATIFAAPGSISEMAFNIDIIGALNIDIIGALNIKYIPFLFALFIPDFFSTFGTVIGVGAKAGLLDKDGNLPGIEKCFYVDSISTVLGSFFCMPCMTTYLESASGVEAGGKTGLTSLSTSVVFLLMFLITPLALMIPAAATAPTLMLIGVKMLSGMRNINYDDATECIPAFLSVALTIFTFNVANGISAAIIVYVILKVASGRSKEVPATMYPFAAVLCYYFYTLTI